MDGSPGWKAEGNPGNKLEGRVGNLGWEAHYCSPGSKAEGVDNPPGMDTAVDCVAMADMATDARTYRPVGSLGKWSRSPPLPPHKELLDTLSRAPPCLHHMTACLFAADVALSFSASVLEGVFGGLHGGSGRALVAPRPSFEFFVQWDPDPVALFPSLRRGVTVDSYLEIQYGLVESKLQKVLPRRIGVGCPLHLSVIAIVIVGDPCERLCVRETVRIV